MNLQMLIVVLVALSLTFSSPTKAANSDWTKIDNAEIFLKLPNKWGGYKNMLGIPYIAIGPKKELSRITISVTPSKDRNSILVFDEKSKDAEKSFESFKKSKLDYLKSIHAEMRDWYPHKLVDWDNVKRVQTIGFKYFHGGNHFIERTYIFACNKQIFHMKSKYRLEEFPDGDSTIEGIVKTFNCR